MRVRRNQLLLPLPARDFIQSGSELFVFFVPQLRRHLRPLLQFGWKLNALAAALADFMQAASTQIFLQTCDGRHFTNRKI